MGDHKNPAHRQLAGTGLPQVKLSSSYNQFQNPLMSFVDPGFNCGSQAQPGFETTFRRATQFR